jgi:phosphonate transport system ATP-binding protein
MSTPAAPGAIETRGLTKRYGDRAALDGVDLEVPSGRLVAVLGANGSGKSTALRCVVGLVEPDGGSIRLAGHEMIGLRGAELTATRRQAAMIFQHIHLVRRLSAFDNVCCGALGRLPARTSLLRTFAERAEERATRLSGGQQQRVAIARALCQRPSVLLADEPVSALDPAATERVMDLLRELAHDDGLAVAAVLHQPYLARRHADRVVGIREGRVAFDVLPDELEEERIEALYAA